MLGTGPQQPAGCRLTPLRPRPARARAASAARRAAAKRCLGLDAADGVRDAFPLDEQHVFPFRFTSPRFAHRIEAMLQRR